MGMYEARYAKYNPEECPNCEHFSGSASDGMSGRCRAFAVETPFSKLLACFDGKTDESCSEYSQK